MKKTISRHCFGIAAASCALGVAAPPPVAAVVSDEDFNALKTLVQQLQQGRQQDQQQILQLQQQLGMTQNLATNAMENANALAQMMTMPERSALHNFTMVGDAEVQYAKTFGNNTRNGFLLADFAPIFLFRGGDKVLFEVGFDMSLQNGAEPVSGHDSGSSTSVGISFAQMDFLMNDYLTFVGGYMLLPLGTYSERTAGFLNKIPDDPLGREFLPGAAAGVQLRGAFAVGESGQMITYAVYGANGPSSSDGMNAAASLDLGGNVGLQSSGNSGNLHSAPSGGGRIGWFYPWAEHHDMEIGVSGQTGVWDDAGDKYWSSGVLDVALHLGSNFELKGEFINSWYGTSDVGTVHPWAVWAQAGYKLAGLDFDLPVLNDIELVGRFDKESDGLGTSTDRYTFGYVYYLTNTLMLEGDYEFLQSSGPNALPPNFLVFQLSYGF